MGETVDGQRFEVSLTSNMELRTPYRAFLAHLALYGVLSSMFEVKETSNL